jgi:hypothetical protein
MSKPRPRPVSSNGDARTRYHEIPRHDTIAVSLAPDTPPRPVPKPVPETDRRWRPSHFPF